MAGCECDEPYVPAAKRAEKALAADPELAALSDRQVGEKLGVSNTSVLRALLKMNAAGGRRLWRGCLRQRGVSRRLCGPVMGAASWRGSIGPIAKIRPVSHGSHSTPCGPPQACAVSGTLSTPGSSVGAARHSVADLAILPQPKKPASVKPQPSAPAPVAAEPRKLPKPAMPDPNLARQARNFHVEVMNYADEFCERALNWSAANEIGACRVRPYGAPEAPHQRRIDGHTIGPHRELKGKISTIDFFNAIFATTTSDKVYTCAFTNERGAGHRPKPSSGSGRAQPYENRGPTHRPSA
jgi:hypothetical protein